MALAERLPIPLRDSPAGRRSAQQQELADLVQRYDRTVYNVALGLVHNRQDAEDISQEVWIKVAHNLANLRDQERFLPWLYRISRNCSLTFLSSQRTRSQATACALGEDDDLTTNLPSPASDSPEHQAISEVERREVWNALMALSESDRQVLVLREFQELPYADIARILNISRGNAEVRVFRARLRFRQQFTKQSEGTVARGMFAFPGLVLLAKLKALFGASVATSATAAGSTTAAGTAAATGGAGTAIGTGIAAQVTVGIAAKVAFTAVALTAAAGVVGVAETQIAPSADPPAAESHVVALADSPRPLVAPAAHVVAPSTSRTTATSPSSPGSAPAGAAAVAPLSSMPLVVSNAPAATSLAPAPIVSVRVAPVVGPGAGIELDTPAFFPPSPSASAPPVTTAPATPASEPSVSAPPVPTDASGASAPAATFSAPSVSKTPEDGQGSGSRATNARGGATSDDQGNPSASGPAGGGAGKGANAAAGGNAASTGGHDSGNAGGHPSGGSGGQVPAAKAPKPAETAHADNAGNSTNHPGHDDRGKSGNQAAPAPSRPAEHPAPAPKGGTHGSNGR